MSSLFLSRQIPRAITTSRTIGSFKLAQSSNNVSNSVSNSRRTMASFVPPAGKTEWLVIIPDHEGVLAKRMEVRPAHFAGLTDAKRATHITMGGGMLEEPPKEGEPLKLNGSALMTYAASREEVMEILESDIYTKSGVWDLSKVQIIPFKTALRKELPTTQ